MNPRYFPRTEQFHTTRKSPRLHYSIGKISKVVDVQFSIVFDPSTFDVLVAYGGNS